jgi:hypothetical protein
MKFGVQYQLNVPRPLDQDQWGEEDEHQIFQEALEQIEFADKLGFDYIWETEHHFLEEYSASSSPEVFLGAVSQRTKNIRLGHGIIHQPVHDRAPQPNPTDPSPARRRRADARSGGARGRSSRLQHVLVPQRPLERRLHFHVAEFRESQPQAEARRRWISRIGGLHASQALRLHLAAQQSATDKCLGRIGRGRQPWICPTLQSSPRTGSRPSRQSAGASPRSLGPAKAEIAPKRQESEVPDVADLMLVEDVQAQGDSHEEQPEQCGGHRPEIGVEALPTPYCLLGRRHPYLRSFPLTAD